MLSDDQCMRGMGGDFMIGLQSLHFSIFKSKAHIFYPMRALLVKSESTKDASSQRDEINPIQLGKQVNLNLRSLRKPGPCLLW